MGLFSRRRDDATTDSDESVLGRDLGDDALDRDVGAQHTSDGIGGVLRGGAAAERREQALGAEPERQGGAGDRVRVRVLGDQRPTRATDPLQGVHDRRPVLLHIRRRHPSGVTGRRGGLIARNRRGVLVTRT